MISDSFARNLRALFKADTAIADIRLQHLLVSFGLKAVAALIGLFGLLMLEFGAYLALVQAWTVIVSALTLAAINFLIASAVLLLANKRASSRELDLAQEVHDAAMRNIQAELLPHPTDATSLLRLPIERALPSLIVPMITLGLRALRRSTSTLSKSPA